MNKYINPRTIPLHPSLETKKYRRIPTPGPVDRWLTTVSRSPRIDFLKDYLMLGNVVTERVLCLVELECIEVILLCHDLWILLWCQPMLQASETDSFFADPPTYTLYITASLSPETRAILHFVSMALTVWAPEATTYSNPTHHLLQKVFHLCTVGPIHIIGGAIGKVHEVNSKSKILYSAQLVNDELDLQVPSYIVALPQSRHCLYESIISCGPSLTFFSQKCTGQCRVGSWMASCFSNRSVFLLLPSLTASFCKLVAAVWIALVPFWHLHFTGPIHFCFNRWSGNGNILLAPLLHLNDFWVAVAYFASGVDQQRDGEGSAQGRA